MFAKKIINYIKYKDAAISITYPRYYGDTAYCDVNFDLTDATVENTNISIRLDLGGKIKQPSNFDRRNDFYKYMFEIFYQRSKYSDWLKITVDGKPFELGKSYKSKIIIIIFERYLKDLKIEDKNKVVAIDDAKSKFFDKLDCRESINFKAISLTSLLGVPGSLVLPSMLLTEVGLGVTSAVFLGTMFLHMRQNFAQGVSYITKEIIPESQVKQLEDRLNVTVVWPGKNLCNDMDQIMRSINQLGSTLQNMISNKQLSRHNVSRWSLYVEEANLLLEKYNDLDPKDRTGRDKTELLDYLTKVEKTGNSIIEAFKDDKKLRFKSDLDAMRTVIQSDTAR